MSHARSSFSNKHLRVLGICLAAAGSGWILPSLRGQDTAILTGAAISEKQAGIADVQVTITDNRHGTSRSALTDNKGLFVFDLLDPGDYSIVAKREGFDSLRVEHVVLPTRGRRSVQLVLKAGAPETIDKDGVRSAGFEADGSAATYLDPSFYGPLPMMNRNVPALTALLPGIQVPQNPGERQEVFDVNGLRAGTNAFTVDGVADTTPVAGDLATPFGQVAMPNSSAAAPTSSSALLSLPLDALQDVQVQSMDIPAEWGPAAGAIVAMTTRSGGSEFHGSAYDYSRVSSLTGNDYFSNLNGVRRQPSAQNRFGATLGGPLEQDQPRTFYFLWFEGLDSKTPQALYNIVPDATTRATASGGLLPFLAAFPVANGPELSQGTAVFAGAVSDPLHSKNFGTKIDRTLTSKWKGFLRYGYSDWHGQSRGTEETAANVLTSAGSLAQTLTAGFQYQGAHSKTTDLRVNYSVDQTSSGSEMDGFGGATPLASALLFPKNVVTGSGTFDLSVIGATGYAVNAYRKEANQRFDVEDSNAIILGTHEYKIGVDVRRIASTYYNLPYASSYIFNGVEAGFNGGLLNGEAVNSILNANTPRVYPTYLQMGAYVQDTWKVANGFTITYGARYDIDPAPRARSGPKPYAVDGNGFLTTNVPLYVTQWKNISPRIGAAYQIDQTPGKELTVRGGFAMVSDTSYGSLNSAFYSAPYQSSFLLTNPPFPTTLSNLRAPALGSMPYGIVYGSDNNLVSPRILQYHVAVERYFGSNQLMAFRFLSGTSSNIIENQSTPSFTPQYDLLNQTENFATYSYKAFQMEYHRRFSDAFQVHVSYTWSHATDTASTDTSLGGAFATLYGTENADSNFDVRSLLRGSGSIRIPTVPAPIVKTLTQDWHLDFNGTYRSGLPYNILVLSSATSASLDNCPTTANSYCSIGVYSEVRPNQLQAGVLLPLPGQPGGEQVYAPAFSIPSTYGQGDMSRNSIRGLGAWQADLALHRDITVGERLKLTLSAQAFNVTNHASLANLIPYVEGNLSSPNFGSFTQSLTSGFGGTSTYGLGSPRTVEFTLRLQF